MLGCLDWQKASLVSPRVSERATAEYFAQQDVLGQFINECCEIGERYVVKSGEIWDAWSAYAHEAGVDAGSKKRSFPDAIKQRGFRHI